MGMDFRAFHSSADFVDPNVVLPQQIIEGIITVVFGVIAWFFLPSFPDDNTFLTIEETSIVLLRVEKDRGDSLPDVLSKAKLIEHLLDWKIWAIGNMIITDPGICWH